MDDISIGYVSQQQADAINWSLNNSIKFNFGIIAGGPAPWPANCAENPEEQYCDDLAVLAMTEAYKNNRVVNGMPDEHRTLEICDHSWGHETWADKFYEQDFKSWMEDDTSKSAQRLREAFPDASIRTMIPPENLATADVLTAMKANNLSILSTQGTLGCHQAAGHAPYYNYFYAPCQHGDSADCVPEGDVYVTAEGWQQVNGVFSTPVGSANSLFSTGADDGITPEQAIGEGKCGCQDDICSLVSAAENNADKSNGLRWAVFMSHPQTQFEGVGSQSYADWLDEFLRLCRASTQYNFHFINFQDLITLKATAPTETLVV